MIAISNADRDKIVELLLLFAKTKEKGKRTLRGINNRRVAGILAQKLDRKPTMESTPDNKNSATEK